ncbi:MAG TPA: hypothetical protein VGH76_15275 [Actinomycetospora sp.]|jgi:hypothetical protein|uniref:hypothetical protein n=1 Tax=Actinomycetospora sp. TaxID=1872135 RepID=UPI002F414479
MTANIELLRQVMTHIEEFPEVWDMTGYRPTDGHLVIDHTADVHSRTLGIVPSHDDRTNHTNH